MGLAVFKTVAGAPTRSWVGSTPTHSRQLARSDTSVYSVRWARPTLHCLVPAEYQCCPKVEAQGFPFGSETVARREGRHAGNIGNPGGRNSAGGFTSA